MVLDFTRLTEETMTYEDYLLHLFYLIDSELKALNLPPLRTRGPAPRLHDSEVITMMLAGMPGRTWEERIAAVMRQAQGAYSLTILTREAVYAVRFRSDDLFGPRDEPPYRVLVDLWESYLEEPD